MKSKPILLCAAILVVLSQTVSGQIQTAGTLLVNIDPGAVTPGPVAWVTNSGSLGGVFQATGLAVVDQPMVAPIGGGRQGLIFDGHNFMEHVANAGGAQVPSPITGNASCSIEIWAVNPTLIDFDIETLIAWGHRGEGLRNMAFGFSTQNDHGAVDRWGGNMPWTPVPAAGVWHHLVYTFDGATTRIYADGVLNNSQNTGAINIAPGKPITLVAQRNQDNSLVGWGGTRGSLSLGAVRIHSGVLSAAQVQNNYNAQKAEFVFSPSPLSARPLHRYTFNSAVTNDGVGLTVPDAGTPGGADAVVAGVYGGGTATFTGSKLHLLGGGSDGAAYVDMPNGLISSLSSSAAGPGQLTVEGWVKVNATTFWPRIFVFGSTTAGEVLGPGGNFTGENFFAFHQIDQYRDWHRVELMNNGYNGGPNTWTTRDFGLENGNGAFGLTHFAVSWDEASGELVIYENGVESSRLVTDKKFNHINDVNNWLGRSNWSPDGNLVGDFDDFRIYGHVLTPAEVMNDYQAGPDAVAVAPGPIQSVRLTLARASMMAGTFQEATVMADYQNVTNLNVTAASGMVYTSSNTNVATVSASGYITAVAEGNVTITATFEGKFDSKALAVTPVSATLRHRYSFSGDARDSVGGAAWDGTAQGGATFANNQVYLDGASGYLQLPPGVITNLEAVTIEAWASFFITEPNWCRLFDFGDQVVVNGQNQGNTSLFLTPHAPGGWLHASITDGNTGQYANRPGALDNTTNAHVVVVVNPNARFLGVYLNGVLVAANNNLSVPVSGVKDLVNFIGRSLFDADPLLNGAVDEFRIYDGVLAPDVIAVHTASGPDSLTSDPGALQSVHLGFTSPMVVNVTQQAAFTGDFANVSGVNLFAYGAPVLTSGNTNFVTVTPAGLIRAVAPGSTTITGSFGGLTNTQNITVVALPPVLTHRYSFNDAPGSGTAADSIGGSAWAGTLIGTTIADGQLLLDGVNGNYLQLPGGLFSNYFALTLEAWASFGQNSPWCRLWDFGDQNAGGGGNTSIFLSPHNGGGNIQMTLFNTVAGNDLVVPRNLDGQTNVHIVGVYDPYAGVMSLYLNGRLAGRNNNARELVTSVNDVNSFIGRSMFNADPYMRGSVDEFRIYSGALSASQVALNDAAGPGTFVSDPGALQNVRFTLNPSMVVDGVQQAQLLGDFANVSGVNLFLYGAPATASSNPNVVTIDSSGLVKAVGVGQSTLVVSYSGYSFTNLVQVSATSLSLTHRYSFNDAAGSPVAVDSVGHADAILNGGASLDGAGHLVLDGTNGYAILPSPLVSTMTNLTVEVWLTPSTAGNWQRIFDFGSDNGGGAGDSYVFLAARGAPGMRFTVRPSGGAEAPILDAPVPLTVGQPAYVAVVYNASAGVATLYQDGAFVASGAVVTPLSAIADVNNWLGRSQYSSDSYLGASYDELRIYEGALTAPEIAAHKAAGPATFPAPAIQAVLSGTNVVVSWPASAPRATLLASATLGAGASWQPVGVTPVNQGGQFAVTLPASGNARFFRLLTQ
jgi:uncharacterized protein YjdB